MQDKENQFIYNFDQADEAIRDVLLKREIRLWSQNGKLYFNK